MGWRDGGPCFRWRWGPFTHLSFLGGKCCCGLLPTKLEGNRRNPLSDENVNSQTQKSKLPTRTAVYAPISEVRYSLKYSWHIICVQSLLKGKNKSGHRALGTNFQAQARMLHRGASEIVPEEVHWSCKQQSFDSHLLQKYVPIFSDYNCTSKYFVSFIPGADSNGDTDTSLGNLETEKKQTNPYPGMTYCWQ